MLFTIIHFTIGKYYPKFYTQFVMGCVIYTISIFILKDFISDTTYEKYKYYVLALVASDFSFFVYKTKYLSPDTITHPLVIPDKIEEMSDEETNHDTTEISTQPDISESNNFSMSCMTMTDNTENDIFSSCMET